MTLEKKPDETICFSKNKILWFDEWKNVKVVFRPLNYFEHFFIFVSAVNGNASISAFTSIVSVPVGIASFVVG